MEKAHLKFKHSLITSSTTPVFGAVYKLVAINKDGDFVPKIKISETLEKITNPGIKEIYRVYDKAGKAVADYLTIKVGIHKKNRSVRIAFRVSFKSLKFIVKAHHPAVSHNAGGDDYVSQRAGDDGGCAAY